MNKPHDSLAPTAEVRTADAYQRTIQQMESALRQAHAALGTCRIMGADADGNYTIELTPKQITAALDAITKALE
jgi:hypothetical protein